MTVRIAKNEFQRLARPWVLGHKVPQTCSFGDSTRIWNRPLRTDCCCARSVPSIHPKPDPFTPGMRCPAAKSRRPGHPLRRQAAKDNGSLVKSVRPRGFGKNARTGETHTQEPWFFMARWDMASAPVCTALFTILGGAVNRANTEEVSSLRGTSPGVSLSSGCCSHNTTALHLHETIHTPS